MKPLELGITVGYFALCIGIAFYFRKRAGNDSASYYGASQKIGFWVNGFAQFSTLLSAASFLGFLGLSYKLGWSFTSIAIGVGTTMGFVFAMLFISGPLRKYSELKGQFTLSAFFEDRFGKKMGVTSSVLTLLLFPAYMVPQILGGGLAGSYVLGIEPSYAIVLVSTVFVGYVLLGGMLSVTWTDFVQGILMFLFMVGLSTAAFVHFGGFAELLPKAVASNGNFLGINENISPWTYFGMSFAVILMVLSSPHVIMRFFTSQSITKGRQSLLLTSMLCFLFHVLGYLGVAAAALVLKPDAAGFNIDHTYFVVMNHVFSPIFRGLAVAGILAAIMSTTDAMLLAVGAEYSTQIYKKLLRPQATEAQTLRAGKWAMLTVGVVTTVLALLATENIGVIAGFLVGAIAASFAVPLLGGLWFRQVTDRGGLWSSLGGLLTYVLVHFFGNLPKFGDILVAIPAAVLFLVLGSMTGKRMTFEQEKLYEALHV